jgi:Uma2 family endonuclease
MATVAAQPATTEDFLRAEAAAGEDVRLELIDGEIVERPRTTRSPRHTLAESRISYVFWAWLDQQSKWSGAVYTGDVRCRFRRNPETLVGIDVGLWLGDQFAEPPTEPPLMDHPPTIAVEILSPSDTHEDVTEKTRLYLDCGVPQVWIADPDFMTVTIRRSNRPPQFFHAEEELHAEPELPGFSVRIESLFTGKHPQK